MALVNAELCSEQPSIMADSGTVTTTISKVLRSHLVSEPATPTPAALMEDGRFMHATCGMHPKLLGKLRSAMPDAAELQSLCEELSSNALSRLRQSSPDTTIIVAPPMGPPVCIVGSADPLVAVWLLLDPLDIDSKQTTFCRGNDAATNMKSLYKWSGTAAALPHTELPGAIPEE